MHKRAISKKGRTLSHLWWICGWRTPQEMGSIKSFLFPTYFRRCWCNNGLHCSQMLNEGDTIKFNTKKEPDPTHLPFHAKKMYLQFYTPTAFSIGIPIVKLEEYCNNFSIICFGSQKICYLSTCEISPEYFKKSGRIKQTAMEFVQEYRKTR